MSNHLNELHQELNKLGYTAKNLYESNNVIQPIPLKTIIKEQLNQFIDGGELIHAGRGPLRNFPDVDTNEIEQGTFDWDLDDEKTLNKISETVKKATESRSIQQRAPQAEQEETKSRKVEQKQVESERLSYSDEVAAVQAYLFMADPTFGQILLERGGVDGLRGAQTNKALQDYAESREIDLGGKSPAELSETDLKDLYSGIEEEIKGLSSQDIAQRILVMEEGGLTNHELRSIQQTLNLTTGSELEVNGENTVETRRAISELKDVAHRPVAEILEAAPIIMKEPEIEVREVSIQQTWKADPETFAQQGDLVLIEDPQNKGLRKEAQGVLERNNFGTFPPGGILFVDGHGPFKQGAAYVVDDQGEVRQVNPETFDMSKVQLDTKLSERISEKAVAKSGALGPGAVTDVTVSVGNVKFTTQVVGVDPAQVDPELNSSNAHARGVDATQHRLTTDEYDNYRSEYQTVEIELGGKRYLMEGRDLKDVFDDVRNDYGNQKITTFRDGSQVDWKAMEGHIDDYLIGGQERGRMSQDFSEHAQNSARLRVFGPDGNMREAVLPPALNQLIMKEIQADDKVTIREVGATNNVDTVSPVKGL